MPQAKRGLAMVIAPRLDTPDRHANDGGRQGWL